MSRANSVTSPKSFLSRTLTRRGADKDETVVGKGPLGLTTLHEPQHGTTAVADIIFVHGLNGGSHSTWTKGGLPHLFWPREWLSIDSAFTDTRIHTFGYPATLDRESILNVHDFARSLLAAVKDCPAINSGLTARLIFVAHSMGGLVVKRAYILGHQEAEFVPVVENIRGIIFLATPHQGSSLAPTLSRLISLMPGGRPFVDDLAPQSATLQCINEEFPRVCTKTQLLSFYETRPMSLGLWKSLIVEKDSATMNVPNERRTLLDADHRNVAMFASANDSAFVAIRNALATVVSAQRDVKRAVERKVAEDDQANLNRLLGIQSLPDDDIAIQDSVRLPGSCEWVKSKDSYKSWRSCQSRLLWIRGRPGVGKSVLSGHVVNDLRNDAVEGCFFFFRSGDSTKSSPSSCLRSLAWQMAMLHPSIGNKIRDSFSSTKDEPVDKTDASQVWRKIYLPGILKVRLNQPQFWVIDAIDECKGSSDLMGFLLRIQEQWPVSILITSRDSVDAHLTSGGLRSDIQIETISNDDVKQDIALFLTANIELLHCPTSSRWSSAWDMAKEIVQKSEGCFLWASVICAELRDAYTAREVEQVLDSVPSNMDALYDKVLGNMALARFGKDLARAILMWTIYSFRALSTDEIKTPIELDIDDKIEDAIERTISKCCGNLVYVDSSDKVHLVHSTAREFLTKKDLQSEFAVGKADAHRRISMVCLQHLTKAEPGANLKARRLGSDSDVNASRVAPSPFTAYASTYIFQHLALVHSHDDEIFVNLSKFLGGPSILRWIEFTAATGDVSGVYQAGKTINSLLARRAQHSPPIKFGQNSLAMLEKWGDDLIHLATKFSDWLKHGPHLIHHLIPPFCPPGSAIRQQFSSPYRGLNVQGLSQFGWDDCLTVITYLKGTKPNVVVSGKGFFAVGMMSGLIAVYDDSVCQQMYKLQHGEPVWKMAASLNGDYIAAGGGKTVRIWTARDGKEFLAFNIPALCLAIAFCDDDTILRVATKQNELFELDIEMGDLLDEPINWTVDLEDAFQARAPTLAALGTATSYLAVIYRGEDMVLWDYNEGRVHDLYEQETGSKMHESLKIPGGSSTVRAVAFGEALESNRVATTYQDGILVVYDTLDGGVVARAPDANTMLLASSPDGRTLAGVDSRGNLTLFDFETLKPLYRIRFDTSLIPKGIVFSSDNRRLIEIRGDQCRVWEPTVLLRVDDFDDEISDTVSISTGPQEITYERDRQPDVTAMASSKSFPVVFCGRSDGSVHVYDISGEPESEQVLVLTAGCPVSLVQFDDESMTLSCADVSGRVSVHTLRRSGRVRRASAWGIEERRMEIIATKEGAVKQILLSAKQQRLLVVTEKTISLWDTSHQDSQRIADKNEESQPTWVTNPTNEEILLRCTETGFDLHSWSTLEKLRSLSTVVSLTGLERLVALQHPRYLATVSKEGFRKHAIRLWDCGMLSGTETVAPEQSHSGISSDAVELVVGSFGPRLVVYTEDHWIASLDLENTTGDGTTLVHHFPIPGDWIGVLNKLVLGLGRGGEILLAKKSELAVIRRGLEVLGSGGSFNPRRGSVRPTRNLAVRSSSSGISIRSVSPAGRPSTNTGG